MFFYKTFFKDNLFFYLKIELKNEYTNKIQFIFHKSL